MTPEEIIAYVDGALNIPMRQVIGSDDILKASAEVGWIPISMKNDFVTIYGENVKYQK